VSPDNGEERVPQFLCEAGNILTKLRELDAAVVGGLFDKPTAESLESSLSVVLGYLQWFSEDQLTNIYYIFVRLGLGPLLSDVLLQRTRDSLCVKQARSFLTQTKGLKTASGEYQDVILHANQCQPNNMDERGLRSTPTKQDALLLERVEKFVTSKYYNSNIGWTSPLQQSWFRNKFGPANKTVSPLKQLQHALEIRGCSTSDSVR
jgi:hypothetical protein